MNNLARDFINRYQGGFPLEASPYQRIAEALGTDRETLLALIESLLDDGTLSRFGPLFDAASMGGSLTLAALSVPSHDYEAVSQRVNDFPEVAHNYAREHELNMWFVLATETPRLMDDAITAIEQATGLPVFNFPKLQTFYLGLWLYIDEQGGVSTQPVPGEMKQGGMTIDSLDREIVQATQAGLPLVAEPYGEIADRCGCEAATVMARLRAMLETGVIRRIGAVPNHYRLGLKANGMSVWDIDDARLDEVGARVGQLDFVSHSYQRPRHLPVWPYNLFAMVHGHDRTEVLAKVDEIESLLGGSCRRRDVLFSTRILKKTGMRLVA